MIRLINVLISFLIMLCLISCEDNLNGTLDENPIIVNCLLLNRNHSVLDSKDPSATELIESTSFEYENGKVISMSKGTGSKEYEYTNGRVSRIAQKNEEGDIVYFAEYSYDSDGKIAGQKYSEITETQVRLIEDIEYIYNNRLLMESRFKNTGRRYTFEYNGPETYISSISKYDKNNALKDVTNIVWDGKHHPYLNLNVPFFGSLDFPAYFEENIVSFTTVYYDESGDVIETNKGPEYTYLYNSHNFPIQREFQVASNTNRTLFEYSNCN